MFIALQTEQPSPPERRPAEKTSSNASGESWLVLDIRFQGSEVARIRLFLVFSWPILTSSMKALSTVQRLRLRSSKFCWRRSCSGPPKRT